MVPNSEGVRFSSDLDVAIKNIKKFKKWKRDKKYNLKVAKETFHTKVTHIDERQGFLMKFQIC